MSTCKGCGGWNCCQCPNEVGDQDHPIPPNEDGTPRKARTGNNPERGGWEIDMDSTGAGRVATRAVRELANRARALEDQLAVANKELEGLRFELGLGKYERSSEAHPHVSASRGGWINTYTGRKVYPLDLRPEDIDIRDIAHALALECRYLNHSCVHYCVAQHSVLLSLWVPPEFALDALLHDAEEAYLGDLARPLKVLPQFAFWREAGKRAAAVIQQALGIGPEPAEVKRLDHMMCGVEAARVMNTHPDWTFQPSPEEWKIDRVWDWREAEQQFLDRYWVLTGKVVYTGADL